jgi:hypothetical protein
MGSAGPASSRAPPRIGGESLALHAPWRDAQMSLGPHDGNSINDRWLQSIQPYEDQSVDDPVPRPGWRCRAQKARCHWSCLDGSRVQPLLLEKGTGRGQCFGGLGGGAAAGFRARASLVAENICLRQQLLVLRRRQPRPRIGGVDRRF